MVNISRDDIVNVYGWFESISDRGDFSDIFKFFVLRNIDKLKEEISAIRNFQSSLKPSDKFLEFDNERLQLVRLLAKTDENGEMILNGDKYFMGENEEEFNTKYAKLTDKYYDVIVEHDSKESSFIELIKEEIEIDITKITYKQLPKDINIQTLYLLQPFLKETMDEIEETLLNGTE